MVVWIDVSPFQLGVVSGEAAVRFPGNIIRDPETYSGFAPENCWVGRDPLLLGRSA